MKKALVIVFAGLFNVSSATVEIKVAAVEGDATGVLREAIIRASEVKNEDVVISLSPGNYNISRSQSTEVLYHISNTSSIEENPDQTKHIGLYFHDMHNVTLEGNGSWIVTHGEMTPIVIDHCEDITLTGFTLIAADPSVPEVRIVNVDDDGITVDVTPPSRYEISDGDFRWVGEGWSFGEDRSKASLPEYAQVFYPQLNVTKRVESPLIGRKSVKELSPGRVRFEFDAVPDVHVGEYYQLRHGIRNEACAFINLSRDVTFRNIEFAFLGNFGLVGQYSENITYDNIRCCPRQESGRTDAGFADFVQMSGCRGKVKILNSHFEGAHDDPINIHGTHLKIVGSSARDRLTVRFMHPQTYGFQAFFKNDEIELVNTHTLTPFFTTKVKAAEMTDDYTMELILESPFPDPEGKLTEDYVVENVTWTPEVEIRNNYFARTPTRGILLTTRRKTLIEGNTFFRIPMASILVSDDARGWYESGPVHDLTIRNNEFVECGSPVICVMPEIDRFDKPVHRNIVIENNRFIFKSGLILKTDAADNIVFCRNVIDVPDGYNGTVDGLIETSRTTDFRCDNNNVITTF